MDPLQINLKDPMVQALLAQSKQGQPQQPQGLGTDPIGAQRTGSFLSNTLGLTDATRALRGEMTPEEQQSFFMGALPNLIPEVKGAGAIGAALHLIPRPLLERLSQSTVRDTGRLGTNALGFMQGGYDPGNPAQIADSLFGHGEPNSRSFDIANDSGQNVARLWTSQSTPKSVYVEYLSQLDPKTGHPLFNANQPGSANKLGPKEMMSLLPELKKHFPEAEEIGGWRVSGARAKAGAEGPTTIKLKK